MARCQEKYLPAKIRYKKQVWHLDALFVFWLYINNTYFSLEKVKKIIHTYIKKYLKYILTYKSYTYTY